MNELISIHCYGCGTDLGLVCLEGEEINEVKYSMCTDCVKRGIKWFVEKDQK